MEKKIIRRTQGKYNIHIGAYDFYRNFLDRNNMVAKEFPYSEYRKIIKNGNLMLIKWMLESKMDLKLPKNTLIGIRKFKPKAETKKYRFCNIDFGKSNKEGEIFYNFNDHSNGYEYKIHWLRARAKWYCKRRYRIAGYRNLTRELAKYIKAGHDYRSYTDKD
jgi:hypothetical protein